MRTIGSRISAEQHGSCGVVAGGGPREENCGFQPLPSPPPPHPPKVQLHTSLRSKCADPQSVTFRLKLSAPSKTNRDRPPLGGELPNKNTATRAAQLGPCKSMDVFLRYTNASPSPLLTLGAGNIQPQAQLNQSHCCWKKGPGYFNRVPDYPAAVRERSA